MNTMLYDLKWMNIKQRLNFNTLMFVIQIKKVIRLNTYANRTNMFKKANHIC